MRRRVEQPPIQPALRDQEHHDFWPGFICALIGLIVLVAGARHITGVETTDGNSAWETQLVKAFSCGGVQLVDRTARPVQPDPFRPPGTFPPPEPAREETAAGPRWIVKVNLGANTPCPT
jgi:hypothetical protein